MDAFVVGLGNPAPISKRKRMNHEGTRRSTKEDPTQDGFPLWNSCPSWFMPLREAALAKDSGSLAATIMQTIAPLSAAAS